MYETNNEKKYEISEEDIRLMLDLFLTKIEEMNLHLNLKEFYEIKDFAKKYCLVLEDCEEDTGTELIEKFTFIYKGKALKLYHLKSYSSDFEIIHLSKYA